MPSPFPGMNPYLEQPGAWHDFHQNVILVMRRMLAPQIRPNYIAKVDTDLYIHESSADERRLFGRADVSVSPGEETSGDASTAATIAAPAQARLPAIVDEVEDNYIEIWDRDSRELITVVELLSPTNKYAGADREQYLAKRRELLKSSTHLVEIDLLRGGPRMPLEELPDCDYCVIVSRAGQRPHVGVWPIALRERLPTIPIPLRETDGDARLDLQVALDQAYDEAGYADYIYSHSPQPRLSSDDQRWADEIIAAAHV